MKWTEILIGTIRKLIKKKTEILSKEKPTNDFQLNEAELHALKCYIELDKIFSHEDFEESRVSDIKELIAYINRPDGKLFSNKNLSYYMSYVEDLKAATEENVHQLALLKSTQEKDNFALNKSKYQEQLQIMQKECEESIQSIKDAHMAVCQDLVRCAEDNLKERKEWLEIVNELLYGDIVLKLPDIRESQLEGVDDYGCDTGLVTFLMSFQQDLFNCKKIYLQQAEDKVLGKTREGSLEEQLATDANGLNQSECIVQGVDTCYDSSENIEKMIFQKVKLQIPNADDNQLRQIIIKQLEQYLTPQAREIFVKNLQEQHQSGFQKVGYGVVATQAALFVTALVGIVINRYQDWKKGSAGFPAEQEYERDRESGYTFPEHLWEDNSTGYEPGNLHGSDLGNDMPGFMPMFGNQPNIVEKNKQSRENEDRPNKPDPDKKYHQKPKDTLPAFPEAKPVKGMTPDGTGDTRGRWRLPSGEILEWDRQHGELEMYDENGKKHLGAFDLNTGAQLKPARSERNIRRFVN